MPQYMIRFDWDSGNLKKLDTVRASGRDFTQDELESIFLDSNRLTEETTTDPISGEQRYLCMGLSNLNRVISVIFVIRAGIEGDPKIRIFNGWKTKGAKLKIYYEKAGK